MITLVASTSTFLTVVLACGFVTPGVEVRHAWSILGMIFLFAVQLHQPLLRTPRRLLPTAGLLALLWLAPFPGFVVLTGVAAAWMLQPTAKQLGNRLMLVAFASAIVLPAIGLEFEQAARALAHRSAESLGGTWSGIGPSRGNTLLVLAAVLCLPWERRAAGLWRSSAFAAVAIALLLFGVPLNVAVHDHLSAWASHGHPYRAWVNVDLVPIVAGALVGLGWWRRSPPSGVEGPGPDRSRRDAVVMAAGALIGLGAIVPLWDATFLPGATASTAAAERRITILNVGGFDWQLPVLGQPDSGMFGLLPHYLEAAGWAVDVVEMDALADGDLQSDVLLVINCPHVWTADERLAVEQFVTDGGGLLCLGDHTNVFDLADGMNSLLSRWGIEFRFDSALAQGAHWSTATSFDPWFWGMAHRTRDCGIGVGASLRVTAPARSVLHAHHALGDLGERENERGAFLGNYMYDAGEQLGDLSLIAARNLGDGLVVVYGDTSGFQNSSLYDTFEPHVEPLLRRLAAGGRSGAGGGYPWSIIALLAAVSLFSFARRAGALGTRFVAGASLGLGLAAAVTGLMAAAMSDRLPNEQPTATDRARLFLDRAHFPRIGHNNAKWNWPSGLIAGVPRSGLLFHDMVHTGYDALRPNDTLAIVGPSVPLEPENVARLGRFMARGGTVLVAASGESSDEVAPLLAEYGVEIAPYTLGRFPGRNQSSPSLPRFMAPSPIAISGATPHDVLFRYGDCILAVEIPVGDGGHLIVIGDTRFFASDNMDGPRDIGPGTVRFFADILVRYCNGVRDGMPVTAPEPLGGLTAR